MKTYDFEKRNGEVSDTDRVSIQNWLSRAIKYATNGQYTISLSRRLKRRSIAQNRLMWLWFACMQRETGQPAIDFHDHYCLTLLGRDIVNPASGVVERVGGHTSELSKEAFTQFLNQVQADAATEFGITLPSPTDPGWEEFYQEYNQFV